MKLEMIFIIVYCVLTATVFVYIKWLCRQSMKIFERAEKGLIFRQPKLYIAICLAMVFMFFSFSIYIFAFQIEDWPYAILLFLPLALIFSLAATCFGVWKVEIRKEEFIYRNYFGITKRYFYKDLQYDFNGRKYAFMMNGKTVFAMPGWIEGGNKLKKSYTKYRLKTLKEGVRGSSVPKE